MDSPGISTTKEVLHLFLALFIESPCIQTVVPMDPLGAILDLRKSGVLPIIEF